MINKKFVLLSLISMFFLNNINMVTVDANTYTQKEKETILYYKYKQQQNKNNEKRKMENEYNLGFNSYKSNDFKNAIYHLNNVYMYYSSTKDINIMLGESYRQLNNLNTAISYLSKAYNLGAQDYTTLTGLGYAYMDTNNYKNAYQYLLKATQIYPNNADAYFNLGVTCNKINNQTCELNSFLKLINLNPSYGTDPYIYIGTIYTNKNDLNSALKYYLQGLNYFNSNSVLNFYTADIYFKANQYSKSIDYNSRTLNIQNNYLDAYYERGFSYLFLNDLDNASNDCNSMYKLAPKYSGTTDLCNAVNKKIMDRQIQQQIEQDQIQQQIDQQNQDAQAMQDATMNNNQF